MISLTSCCGIWMTLLITISGLGYASKQSLPNYNTVTEITNHRRCCKSYMGTVPHLIVTCLRLRGAGKKAKIRLPKPSSRKATITEENTLSHFGGEDLVIPSEYRLAKPEISAGLMRYRNRSNRADPRKMTSEDEVQSNNMQLVSMMNGGRDLTASRARSTTTSTSVVYSHICHTLNRLNASSVMDIGSGRMSSTAHSQETWLTMLVKQEMDLWICVEQHQPDLHSLLDTVLQRPPVDALLSPRGVPLRVSLIAANPCAIGAEFAGLEAVCLINLLEHLDPSLVPKFCHTVFASIRPAHIIAVVAVDDSQRRSHHAPLAAPLLPLLRASAADQRPPPRSTHDPSTAAAGLPVANHIEWTSRGFETWCHQLCSQYPEYRAEALDAETLQPLNAATAAADAPSQPAPPQQPPAAGPALGSTEKGMVDSNNSAARAHSAATATGNTGPAVPRRITGAVKSARPRSVPIAAAGGFNDGGQRQLMAVFSRVRGQGGGEEAPPWAKDWPSRRALPGRGARAAGGGGGGGVGTTAGVDEEPAVLAEVTVRECFVQGRRGREALGWDQ